MNKIDMKDLLIAIDSKNIITSIFPTNSVFSSFVDSSVNSIIERNSFTQFDDFMKKIDDADIALHHQMTLTYLKKNYDCCLNGYKNKETTLIFVLFDVSSDVALFQKMMELNSQQMNELLSLKKEVNVQDSKIYEEMSRLNSELLNSKRTIEKQNSELHRYNALLKQMSIEDSLTGSYNRRHFYDYMKTTILSSQKDVIHSLIMIDFNNFKLVNDQFGHDAGDRLLIVFVKLTKEIIEGRGEVFRIGGDEFMIVLHQMNLDASLPYMKRIEDLFLSNSTVASLSYGIIAFNECEINHEFDVSNLIKRTDELMYENKKKSKNISK